MSNKRLSSSKKLKPLSLKWQYLAVALLAVASIGAASFALSSKPLDSNAVAAQQYNEMMAAQQTNAAIAPVPSDAAPVLTVKRSNDPLRILFVGDSLAGSLHATTEAMGFRPLMVEALSLSGPVDERHGHKSGGSAGEVAQLVEIGESNQLAVIELGTNDIGKTELDQFRADYKSLLTTIRTSSPEVQFLCAGTWQNADLSAPYDRIISDECRNVEGIFVPLTDLHVTAANRGPAGKMDVFGAPSDTFHPNDTGYAAIAERLLSKIDAT